MRESNKSVADRLRAAAEKLEKLERETGADVQIHFHGCYDREAVAAVLSIADEGTVKQDKSRGTHWANLEIEGVRSAVFFNPEILGKTKVRKVVSYKTTDASVLELIKAPQ